MKIRANATSALSAPLVLALSLTAAAPATAGGGDVVGGIIGGMIGAAIMNGANNSTHHRTTTRRSSSGISSAQRQANIETQTALNFFGFPVGTPDGSIGPKTRAAISTYQVTLGYPATGQLSEYERMLLVTAYQRGIAGGPVVAETVSSSPMGIRGLLILQRDELAGVTPAGSTSYTTKVSESPVVETTTAAPLAVAPAAPDPLPAPLEAAAPPLPSFMGNAVTQVSLASHCNKVSLLTNTNGGYQTVASMTDPAAALSEQFCLVRTYAMAQGEELAAKVTGFTPQQIAEQCAAFGPVLHDYVSALSLKPKPEVLSAVQGFVMASGMPPQQLAGTAKICLGVGYTTDNMDLAVGSALVLTALGETAYAELAGHHLVLGFGATERRDLAPAWYDAAFTSGGSVFAPGMPERIEVLRKASLDLGGTAAAAAPAPVKVNAALPTFSANP